MDEKTEDVTDELGDLSAPVDTEADEKIKKPSPSDAIADDQAWSARRGVGFFTVLLMSALAAGFGAVGGAFLSQGVDIDVPGFDAKPDISALQAETSALKTQLGALERAQAETTELASTVDLSTLETRLSVLEERPIVTDAGTVIDPALVKRVAALETAGETSSATDLKSLDVRVAAVETALSKVEQQSSAVETLTTRVTELEKTAMADKPVVAASLEDRLAQLEGKPTPTFDVSMLETRLAVLEEITVVQPPDLSVIRARLTKLETTLSNVSAALPVPAFPSKAVLAALAADRQTDKGWLGRTLSKHVKVADEVTAEAVINIEKSLASGDIDTALAQSKQLPENGRAAAQDWIDAVSAQRKLP